MNIKSIIRASVLMLLAITALICVFSEPCEDSASWGQTFLVSKGIGAIAIYAVVLLFKRWGKEESWLSADE